MRTVGNYNMRLTKPETNTGRPRNAGLLSATEHMFDLPHEPVTIQRDVTMASMPPSTEARAKARRLLEEVTATGAAQERAFNAIPRELLNGAAWKGLKGSARKIDRILKLAPRPPDLRSGKFVCWRFLSGDDRIPGEDDAPAQPCVAVRGVLAQHKRPFQPPGYFGVAFTTHALARMFDRGGHDLDGAAICLEAHNHLLVLNKAEGAEVYALPEVIIPAGPKGFFIGKGRSVGPSACPVIVARTYYVDEMADQRRVSDAEAWRALMTTIYGRA
jgi:hypothetical protein